MKKILSVLLVAMMLFSLVACATTPSGSGDTSNNSTSDTTPEFVTITSLDGDKKPQQVQIPYNPQRICILDLAALDVIDNLGLGDRVVGCVNVSMDYLSRYVPSDSNEITNVGSVKTPSVEDVMECEPDVIFIGGRLSSYYDQLSQIAPVVYLPTDYDTVLEQTVTNAKTIASLFGMEEKIDALVTSYQTRIDAIVEYANGASAMLLITTNGGVNVKGNDGKCSMICVSCGFENVGVEEEEYTATHGNITSFEYIAKVNPEYIFVMDRDAATNSEGAQLAAELLDNDLINNTNCVKNGKLVILENPDIWYTAEGGITAMGIMLSDLENGLGLSK